MDPVTAKLMSAAGAADDPIYVDDVFSTFLYEGNGAAQAIRNGINLGTAFGGNSYDFRGQTVMSKSGALSGATASKTFTVSFWFYAKTLGGTIYTEPAGPTIGFAGSDLSISGFNSSYSTIFGVSTAVTAGRWYHVLASWDLANSSNRYLYINDAAVSPTYSDYTNDTIAINVNGTRYVGSTNGSSGKFDGNIAHLYYDTTYRDLSTTSNRRLFVTAGLEPATGQASLNPLLYLPLNAATGAATNSGTGGNFTATTGPFFDEGFGPGTGTSGEGGMIWTKSRTSGLDHYLSGPDIGTNSVVRPNSTNAKDTSYTNSFTTFNNNGFSLGTDGIVNNSGTDYVAWTFRKCPGFFDVVTYTGTGSVQNISHSLGSAPGSIWIKSLSSGAWTVTHRSTGWNYYLELNDTLAAQQDSQFSSIHNSTAPTASVFTLGNSGAVNASGTSYVAYIFAHDDQSFGDDEDEAIIKCGSFTASDGSPHTVNVGFEPQWVIIKRTTSVGDWTILDNMRGWVADTSSDGSIRLLANSYNAEEGVADMSGLTSTGFTVDDGGITYGSNQDYIYIAIRRPHKPPQAGAEAFGISSVFAGNNVSDRHITTEGVTADLIVSKTTTSQVAGMFTDRIRGGNSLGISGTQSDADSYWSLNNWYDLDVMDGYKIGGTSYGYSNNSSHSYISYAFKRAPGFFDVVAYSGNSTSGSTVPHNLGVVPELMIIKSRNATRSWRVYDANTGTNASLKLSNDAAKDSNSAYWSTPTADNIILGTDNDTNSSSYDYIAYLFATLAGISKVGNYSGSSSNVTVDCGFTNGARFVLIKRTNGSGEWFIYDSTRGLTANTDPYLRLNNTAGQATESENWVESHSSGFKVNSTAPSDLNGSGNTYLFLAIA